ncbi:uncharacterized protein LOC129916379 [Episyrphus balteatus]|uniref:uncharacterized protein LOC129916379 n=1 Tax=Episyrphus balteatus TaxID=286459 RepID=UPI002485038E|nr:uncharacterized protein LOC129916379 [Episyrphus balteatus]
MSALQTKLSNSYESFCNYMQKDTKGAEIAIYTASGLLFAYAYYNIRPITKFGKGTDIPKIFIRDKITQYGKIDSIDPSSKSGPLLLVNHKPPLGFLVPFAKQLPVKLPGVAVNANGYSWLQTVAVGKRVEFIPISRDGDDNSAVCRVLLVCPENKQGLIDASEALLSLGFGKTIDLPQTINDAEWQKYYKHLMKVEKNAKDQRLGLWSTSLPPTPWPLKFSKKKLNAFILSLLPADRRLPELVR